MAKYLYSALFVVTLLIGCSSLMLVRGQDCGPPAGNRCSGSDCCSQFGNCGNTCNYCGAGCQSGFGSCGGCDCFPGTATVITRSGTKLISELRVGEQLKLQLQYKRAQDVRIGDQMLVVNDGGHLLPFMVSDIGAKFMAGLYKPLTLGGDIVVNQVLASCHSEWFFNALLKQAGGTNALPPIYQAMFTPLRFLFNAMPTDAYVWMYEKAQSLSMLTPGAKGHTSRFVSQLIFAMDIATTTSYLRQLY